MAQAQHGAGAWKSDRFIRHERLRAIETLETWRGLDHQTGRGVILTQVPIAAITPETLRRLDVLRGAADALSAAGLSLPVADARDDDLLVVARHEVPGTTLSERLRRGPLSLRETIDLGATLLEALGALHERRLLHRDLTTSHVVIAEDGQMQSAILAIEGVSWSDLKTPPVRKLPLDVLGHLSPEIAGLVDRPMGVPSDLYSFGIILFACLAGHPPFRAADPAALLLEHLNERPPELEGIGAMNEVLQRLLRKEPADRYQSSAGALRDLRALAAALDRGEREPRAVIGIADHRRTLTDAAFLGRDEELAKLEHVLQKTTAGEGVLVLVEGDSGTGKTRLLDALCAKNEALGRWVLRGQARALEAPRPFEILTGVIHEVLQRARADPEERARLHRRLGDDLPALSSVFPELGELWPTAAVSEGPEAMGPRRSQRALQALLAALGRPGRPALVVLDDLQWADDLSLQLLQAPPPAFVALVCAFRGEETTGDSVLRRVRPSLALTLQAFRAEQIRWQAESMAGPLPEEALSVLTRLSEGNPFMVSAVLHGLVESAALSSDAEGWKVDPRALAGVMSSRRAAGLLARRLETLPPDTRRLLQVGAVLGKKFELAIAAQLAEQTPADARRAADEACARHILWADWARETLSFVHDRLREAMLASLAEADRRELHRRAAAVIERVDASRDFELAYHLDSAGAPERALPHALGAAERARARYALELAEQLYRIADRGGAGASQATRRQIAEGLGDVLDLRGNYEAATQALENARSLAEDRLARARLQRKIGEIYFKRGELTAATEVLRDGLGLLGRRIPKGFLAFFALFLWEAMVQFLHSRFPKRLLGRRPLARAEEDLLAVMLYDRLSYLWWFGNLGAFPALWGHLRSMNLAERYPPTRELAHVYTVHIPSVGITLPFVFSKRAFAFAERALEIRAAQGDTWGRGQTLAFYSAALLGALRYSDALEKAHEAIRLLDRAGDRWDVCSARWQAMICHHRLGNVDASLAEARELLRQAQALGDPKFIADALDGWAKASGGDVPHELVAEQLSRDGQSVRTLGVLWEAEAIRRLRRGRAGEAAQMLHRARRTMLRAGIQDIWTAPVVAWRATARRVEAETTSVFAPKRRRATLRSAARAALSARMLSRIFRSDRPQALRESALVAALRGSPRRARHLFDESVAVAERYGMRLERAQTLWSRARVGADAGWTDTASDRANALSEFQALGVPPVPGESAERRTTLAVGVRFDTLLDAGRRIATSLSAEAAFDALREGASSVLRAKRTQVLTWPLGTPTDDAERLLYALSRRAVLDGGVPVTLSEALGPPSELDAAAGAGVRSALCAPVVVRGHPVAVLAVSHPHVAGLFGEDEQRVALFLTTLAGAALENVESYQQAQAAIRARDEFLSIASHELKTPLTPIQITLATLQRRLPQLVSDQASLEWLTGKLRALVQQGDRLAHLIETLLDVSRISSGRLALEQEELELGGLVKEVVARCESRAAEVGSRLQVEARAEVSGRWDRMRIEQIVTNLLDNALKFGRGRPVEVSVRRDPASAIVTVTDHGIGIAPEDQQRIFERFERGVSEKHFSGLGLGLFIVKQILDAMGGSIELRSRPQEGATFTVRLPLEPAGESVR